MIDKHLQILYECVQNDMSLMRFCRQKYNPGFCSSPSIYEYLKIFRVTSGKALWEINGTQYLIVAGDIIMLNNTEPRALRRVDGPEPLILEYGTWLPIAVQCSPDCHRVYFNRPPEFRNQLIHENPMHSELHCLFNMLSQHAYGDSPFRDEIMQQLLRTLFVTAAQAWLLETRTIETVPHSYSADYDAIAETVHYIMTHPTEKLSEQALAERVYMSKNRFIRLFCRYNGMTPAEYVRIFRVRYAMECIQSGKTSISEAAMACGFGSLSGFYKAVEAVTGNTPGGRKQINMPK